VIRSYKEEIDFGKTMTSLGGKNPIVVVVFGVGHGNGLVVGRAIRMQAVRTRESPPAGEELGSSSHHCRSTENWNSSMKLLQVL